MEENENKIMSEAPTCAPDLNAEGATKNGQVVMQDNQEIKEVEAIREIAGVQAEQTVQNGQEVQAEQEGEEGQDGQEKKQKKIGGYFLIARTVVAIGLQILILLSFLFGLVKIFGTAANPATVITLMLQIFSISKATAYRCIFGLALGILYFVFFVLVLNGVVRSCGYALTIVGKKPSRTKAISAIFQNVYDQKTELRLRIVEYAYHAFEYAFILTILSNMVYRSGISGALIAVMAVAGILFFLNSIIKFGIRNVRQNVWGAALFMAKTVLVYAVICILLTMLCQPSVQETVNGFMALLNGSLVGKQVGNGRIKLHFLYGRLILPILYLIASVIAMILVHYYILLFLRGDSLRRRLFKTLIFVAVLLVLNLIFQVLIVAESYTIHLIRDWLQLSKAVYLPVFLLLLAWLFLETEKKGQNG